jgi:hypothetical protein
MAICQPSIYNNQKIETRTIDEKSISRAMGPLFLAFMVHVLWKECLNSDGQQFHQCQQKEWSPLISTCWT